MPHPKAGKTKKTKSKNLVLGLNSEKQQTWELSCLVCVCECVCGGGEALIPSTAIVINNKQISELSKGELVDGGKRGRKSNEVRVGVGIQLYIR